MKDFFGRYTLRQISPLLIEKFKLQLLRTDTARGTPRKESSVNTTLALLSGILTKAVSDGFLKENQVHKVKHLPIEETKPRTLSADEETALLSACESGPAYLKPMVQLALWLGWRKSEILYLRKSDIDFGKNLVFVPDAKWARDPRKTKGIPMSQKVRDLLLELVEISTDEYLFTNKRTGKPYSKPMVHIVFKAACERAGITDFKFHGLRHTFGTKLAERGVGVEKIQRAMGHSSVNTTMIYVHTSRETLKSVMDEAAKDVKPSSVIVPLKKRKAG